MAPQRTPDSRLVYLHCSSIFSGANLQVRRAKKITQLLEKHGTAIETLTREFTVPAIAAVAKELLEEQVFESLPRARLRYPELFQSSETREAERAASESEAVKVEAEAALEVELTSDNEEANECLAREPRGQGAEPEGESDGEAETSSSVEANSVEQCIPSTPPAHEAPSLPRLHPIYLPFKTQHNILVPVQSLLEECCLDFGKTWVPNLMEAQKWHETGSLELTKWTQRFSKYAKSLPSSAINLEAGKSIARVLFGTSPIRHTAVHRLPTSAAGIMNMLTAAITFAETLNDPKRAKIIAEIKSQLEASIEEIAQHQVLLERKLTDRLEDIARRRAELDELERLSIEEMLGTDKMQRTRVGSALERVLVNSILVNPLHVSNACSCQSQNLDEPKSDSEPTESTEKDHNQKASDGEQKAQAHAWVSLWKGQSCQSEDLQKKDQHGHDKVVHVAQDVGWEWHNKPPRNSAAISDILVECQEPTKEEIPTDEVCLAALSRACSRDELYSHAAEEKLGDDVSLKKEAIFKECLVEEYDAGIEAMQEAPQEDLIIDGFRDVEEHPLDQDDGQQADLQNTPEPTPELDVATACNLSAEEAEALVPSTETATDVQEYNHSSYPLPSTTASSKATSVPDAAADAPTEVSHTIVLKIVKGSKVIRSIVSINSCTQTAVLNEANAYWRKCAASDPSLGGLSATGRELALVSVEMDGWEMDMSSFAGGDLSSLVRAVEKTGIPQFTLRVRFR